MLSFLDLPPELMEHIISVLAEEKPPSAKLLHEEPSESLFRSGIHSLKDLSQACRATHELCFPSLFSAVRVDLNRIDGFLSFSKRHSLSSHVNSVVLYHDPHSRARNVSDIFIDNPGYRLWLPMVRVIDSVKPSVMTVIVFASLFAKILPYQLNLTDQWAFSIPYQVLQLRMPQDLASMPQTSQDTIGSQNVFQMRPWTHCTFNQGSSIKGYSSYEYFSKQTPSIFYPWDGDQFVRQMMEGSFENLTSIDYIAIFPIDHIMRFCLCMNIMKNLKRLRIQLAPTASNHVLDNPAELWKCQPGDLWQEFESCYKTLAKYIRNSWKSRATSIEEFVSLDYVNPSLHELIDRNVGRYLAKWESDVSGGRWTREKESPNEIDSWMSDLEQFEGNEEWCWWYPWLLRQGSGGLGVWHSARAMSNIDIAGPVQDRWIALADHGSYELWATTR